MTNAHFYIYNVGHGLCTLLTGKRKEGEEENIPYCGVFDCGTKAKNYFCDTTAIIEDMKEKILKNAQGQEIIQIDDVVISHQDIDHWNKLLELFLSLNDIPKNKTGSYNGIIFGKKDEQAWRLSYVGSRLVLYSVRESRYIKEMFTNKYNYHAHVEFQRGEIVSFIVNIEYNDDSIKKFNLHLDDEDDYYVVTLSTCAYDEFIIDKDESTTTSVVALLSIIAPYIDEKVPEFDIIKEVVDDVASSFSNEELVRLDTEFDPDNVNEIKIPIKNVVMGGDKITRGYARLKSLLDDISMCYGGKGVRWERDGAYIIMSEEDNELSDKAEGNGFNLKKYPDYKITLDLSFSLAVIRNLTSVIVQNHIERDNVLILPGDVTQHAFMDIVDNAFITLASERVKLFLAPHHGSDNTNFLYESDKRLSDWQPLSDFFDELLKMPEEQTASECNLVISGYNKSSLHPGESFVELAAEKFSSVKSDHKYAYAKTLIGKKRAGIMNTIQLMPTLNKRIYTTNCLPFYEERYFDYCDGVVSIGDLSDSGLTRKSTRNSLRRPPPDNSFI